MADYSRNFTGFPWKFQVVIGDEWNFDNVLFEEDDIIELQVCTSESNSSQILYSEDGTAGLSSSNRLEINFVSQMYTGTNTISLSAYNDVYGSLWGGFFYLSDTDATYSFKEIFTSATTLNPASVANTHSLFSSGVVLNDGIFKSMTITEMMSQASFYPAASGDDGWSNGSTFDNTSNDLIIGNYSGNDYEIFLRFPNVTIPHGVTVLRTFLRFTIHTDGGTNYQEIDLYFVDADNPAAPTSLEEFNGLSLTTNKGKAMVGGSPLYDGDKYCPFTTQGYEDALQEVLDRSGWTNGNALIAVLKKDSYSSGEYHQFSAYDHASAAEKAELVVNWVEGYYHEISDSLELSESQAATLDVSKEITESVEFAENHAIGWEKAAEETLTLNELFTIGWDKSINDSVFIADALTFGWLKSVSESLGLADEIATQLAISVIESLVLKDSSISGWNGTEIVASLVGFYDNPIAGKLFKENIVEDLELTDASAVILGLVIIDSLVCSSTADATGLFERQVSETINMNDEALRCWEKLISDAIGLVDSLLCLWHAYNILSEAFGLSDSAGGYLEFEAENNETLTLTPSVSLNAVIHNLIEETLNFSISLELDNEVWECWVLNTGKFYPSIYSGFNFNSYAVYEGRAYGCKDDGIYEITGDTDNSDTIHTGVVLPEMDFGTTRKKRMRKAYIGISGTSPALKVEADGKASYYALDMDNATISRRLKGKKWTVSVEDFDELDFIELIPVVLTR